MLEETETYIICLSLIVKLRENFMLVGQIMSCIGTNGMAKFSGMLNYFEDS